DPRPTPPPCQASGGDLGTTYQDVSARPCYVQNVPSPRFGRGLDKMANERLRSAMAKAGKDIANLADATAVDPKTVQRWLAGRVPHPRHRWVKIGRDTSELQSPDHLV